MLKPAKSRILHQPPPKAGCILAFGKHPGWEDHAEDVGDSSPALAKLKQHLYNEAIAGVIDQGRWQTATSQSSSTSDASGKAAWPYGHDFVTWIDGAFIAGIIMPSRDARQRDRYPLIIAAHLEPYPSKARLSQVLRELRQVHAAAGTKDQQALRRAVAVASASLSQPQPSDEAWWSVRSAQLWAEAARWPAPATPTEAAMSVSAPAGLLRSLYELSRELGAPGAGEVAQHLRGQIAAGAGIDSASELPLWIAAVWALHGAPLPVMALKPFEQAVVDVVIGLPDAATLWPIRQDLTAVPPASEVPYAIDAADQSRLMSIVSGWALASASGESLQASPSKSVSSTPTPQANGVASPSASSRGTQGASQGSSRGIPTGLIVAGVVAVLLVLAVLAWMLTR